MIESVANHILDGNLPMFGTMRAGGLGSKMEVMYEMNNDHFWKGAAPSMQSKEIRDRESVVDLTLGKAACVSTDRVRDATAIPLVAARNTTEQDGALVATGAALLFPNAITLQPASLALNTSEATAGCKFIVRGKDIEPSDDTLSEDVDVEALKQRERDVASYAQRVRVVDKLMQGGDISNDAEEARAQIEQNQAVVLSNIRSQLTDLRHAEGSGQGEAWSGGQLQG